jgi:hypothetical protein
VADTKLKLDIPKTCFAGIRNEQLTKIQFHTSAATNYTVAVAVHIIVAVLIIAKQKVLDLYFHWIVGAGIIVQSCILP